MFERFRRIEMYVRDERGLSRLAAILVVAAALAIVAFGGLAVAAQSSWDVLDRPFGGTTVRSDDSSGRNDEADENEAPDSRGESEADDESDGSHGEP
jgi:hypothetical protein